MEKAVPGTFQESTQKEVWRSLKHMPVSVFMYVCLGKCATNMNVVVAYIMGSLFSEP